MNEHAIWNWRKPLALTIGAGGAVLVGALTDNALTLDESIAVAIAVIGAVIANIVPQMPDGWARYSRLVLAAVLAGLQAFALYFVDRALTAEEWGLLLVAVLTALGVYEVPEDEVV